MNGHDLRTTCIISSPSPHTLSISEEMQHSKLKVLLQIFFSNHQKLDENDADFILLFLSSIAFKLLVLDIRFYAIILLQIEQQSLFKMGHSS